MSSEAEDFAPVPPNDVDGDSAAPTNELVMPARWCKACNTAVVPIGKGRCPVCGKFTNGNSMKLRDSVSESRRNEIIHALIADFGEPQSTVARSQLGALADVLAKLWKARPGTTEHVRLVHAQQQLVAALRESMRVDRLATLRRLRQAARGGNA
jgi:hypothetical protein